MFRSQILYTRIVVIYVPLSHLQGTISKFYFSFKATGTEIYWFEVEPNSFKVKFDTWSLMPSPGPKPHLWFTSHWTTKTRFLII